MNSTKSIFSQSRMMETVTIKSEPTSEEEDVKEILPDLLELPVQIKSDVTCKEELGSNLTDNQENCENENRKTNFVSDKMLVNINGVLYLLEKIPDNVVQENETKEVVADTDKSPLDRPVRCPQCGKIFNRRKNLKHHMQVCSNSLSYNCKLCSYQTSSETSLRFHISVCEKRATSQAILDNNKDLFSRFCSKCNLSMPLETKACDKCGSLNRWQCKNCSKHFESFSIVRHHSKTACKPISYYYCRKCDYRSAFNLNILTHIRRNHPELKSSGSLKYIKKVKVPINAEEIKHLCSKCGKNFDEAEDLNRHRYMCNKSKSKNHIEQIENSDSSQTDTSIELTYFKPAIILHCKTCDKDIESKKSCVTPQKSCDSCSSTLEYKCTRCDILQENYDAMLNHVKTMCSQQKLIKCNNCNFETDSEGKLIQHERNLHGDISATCTNCGKYFTNSTLFVWHVASCGVSQIFHCDMCPFKTCKKSYLQRHVSSFHGKSNATDSNGITNSNRSKFQPRIQSFCVKCQRRQQMHNQAKFCKICRSELQFRCLTCNKTCTIDNSEACEHVKVHLKQLGLECQRCGRRFINRSKYQVHIEGCGKTRRYNCEFCFYSTRFGNHLKKHKEEVHGRSTSENANVKPTKIRSSQPEKCTAGHQHFSDESEIIKTELIEEICMKMDEDLNTLTCQDSGMEVENPSLLSCKNYTENKLNLECKVVLTRLKK